MLAESDRRGEHAQARRAGRTKAPRRTMVRGDNRPLLATISKDKNAREDGGRGFMTFLKHTLLTVE